MCRRLSDMCAVVRAKQIHSNKPTHDTFIRKSDMRSPKVHSIRPEELLHNIRLAFGTNNAYVSINKFMCSVEIGFADLVADSMPRHMRIHMWAEFAPWQSLLARRCLTRL